MPKIATMITQLSKPRSSIIKRICLQVGENTQISDEWCVCRLTSNIVIYVQQSLYNYLKLVRFFGHMFMNFEEFLRVCVRTDNTRLKDEWLLFSVVCTSNKYERNETENNKMRTVINDVYYYTDTHTRITSSVHVCARVQHEYR